MSKLRRYSSILCCIILILIIFLPSKMVNINENASYGVLDLSNYDFINDKNVELRGQWELYYDELLSYKDIENRSPENFYTIPGRLSTQLPGIKQGYMTLHLKIQVPKDDIYGLYFYSLFTSSDIWINGQHYGGHGKVGKTIDEEQAIYRPEYLYFPSQNKNIDILIHTSVYRDVQPHLNPAVLGTKNSILKLSYFNILIDGFTIGILFIMIFLNCGFYFAKHKQKRHIYFSIICIIIFFRCLILNSRILSEFFPSAPFELLSKIAAITFYLWVTFYILFLNDLFKNKMKKLKNLSIIFGTFFTSLCLLTNSTIYDYSAILAQVIVILFTIYLFIFMLKQLKLNNRNARLNFFPFIVLCSTAINDFLVNNSVLSKNYCAVYGGILFVLAESLFIVIDYFENTKKLDNLNRDGLTSLFNNKYIKTLISKQIEKYNNKNEIFSLIMIDVDNFKSINDNYGHLFGDKVLVDISNILLEISDSKYYPGRFGGDEFILILPKTTEKNSFIIAHKIMDSLASLSKNYNIDTLVSLSIGIYENHSSTVEECMNHADDAMYFSKTNGKNQINNSKAI